MSNENKMTISEAKEYVARIEGFNITIEGGSSKKIITNFRKRKQSPDEMLVKDWISQSFPDMEKGSVSVILYTTGKAIIRGDLGKVRENYPPDFRKKAKGDKKKAKLAAETKEQLEVVKKAKNKITREATLAKKAAIQKMNEIKISEEREAVFHAFDKALRELQGVPDRVKLLCGTAVRNAQGNPQNLVEGILGFWISAERKVDILNENTRH